jgi:hypothetical protein
MIIGTGGRAEPLRDGAMRRFLRVIQHQRSTPFTSFNDGVPIHVVQRYLTPLRR